MALKKINFEKPEFLLCEIPVKDGTHNDNRVWVYCTSALSLIEFVPIEENMVDFEFKKELVKDVFCYDNAPLAPEFYMGVFVQNNCDFVDKNADEVLKAAWEFFEKYLVWEDENINNDTLN